MYIKKRCMYPYDICIFDTSFNWSHCCGVKCSPYICFLSFFLLTKCLPNNKKIRVHQRRRRSAISFGVSIQSPLIYQWSFVKQWEDPLLLLSLPFYFYSFISLTKHLSNSNIHKVFIGQQRSFLRKDVLSRSCVSFFCFIDEAFVEQQCSQSVYWTITLFPPWGCVIMELCLYIYICFCFYFDLVSNRLAYKILSKNHIIWTSIRGIYTLSHYCFLLICSHMVLKIHSLEWLLSTLTVAYIVPHLSFQQKLLSNW